MLMERNPSLVLCLLLGRGGELLASQESVCNDPNVESLEAIREGDAFLRSGKEGCFTNGADLIAAAMAWWLGLLRKTF